MVKKYQKRDQMLILGIETCLSPGFVLLGKEEKILAWFKLPPRSSSGNLMPLVDSLLDKTGTDIREIDAVAVTKGPGSFTGLRVGMSLAKSVSFSLNTLLVGIPTLDCIALNVPSSGILCSLVPAYRNHFFAAFFYKNQQKMEKKSDYLFLPLEEIVRKAKDFSSRVLFVPFPADCVPRESVPDLEHLFFREQVSIKEAFLSWALRDIDNQNTVDPLALKPIYVCSPIINRKKR